MAASETTRMTPVHPGEILADELEALDLSARKFADHIGVPPNAVTAILHGERRITAQMALRLGKAFGTGEQYWLNLQALYDIRLAMPKMQQSIDAIPPLVTT